MAEPRTFYSLGYEELREAGVDRNLACFLSADALVTATESIYQDVVLTM